MTSEAERIVSRWGKMKSARANYEWVWEEVARFVRPLRAEFLSQQTPGTKRNQWIFDSTPLLAADNFSGGIYGMMTNPANRWFSLQTQDEDLNEYDPVRDWLYDVETRLLNSFGPQVSRFYNVIPALYADLACLGTAVFYSEEGQGERRINDNVRALSECCIAENAWGEVDTLYRRFSMSGDQATKLFGDALSQNTKSRIAKEPMCETFFIHCVEPNDGYLPGRIGPAGKRFVSVYVEEEQKHEVSRSGYDEMPYQVPRWTQAAGETYGRGLGELAIADVKTLNQMSRTSLEAAQKAANPPLAAPDEGVIKQARTFPNGITYGAVDNQGRLLLQPLYEGGNHGLTLELMEQRRNAIRDAFYFSLMQMVGGPNMTASEFLGRQEEKLRLMGPNLGRIQGEFLSPLIKRRFGMLLRQGALPPAPQEMQGRGLNIEYVSPLARAQMAGEANAVVRLYQSILPIAAVNQEILDNVDDDEAARAMGRGFAVPAKVLRGADQVAKRREQRQQAEQMQAALAAGQQGADIANKLSGAVKNSAQADATAA